jgi:hypothetical protein
VAAVECGTGSAAELVIFGDLAALEEVVFVVAQLRPATAIGLPSQAIGSRGLATAATATTL